MAQFKPGPLHYFAAALLVLDGIIGVLLFTTEKRFGAEGILGGLVFGLVCAQMGMLAVFFVFARWPLVVRTVAGLACAIGLAVITSATEEQGDRWRSDCIIILCIIGTVMLAALAARLAGWRLLGPGGTALGGRQWQFSMGGIFSVITSVALVLALVRWLEFDLARELQIMPMIVPIHASPTLIAYASVFGWRHPKAALASLILSTIVLAGCLALSMPGIHWAFCWLVVVHVATAAIGFGLARTCGYRMIWSWSGATSGGTPNKATSAANKPSPPVTEASA